SIALNGRQVFIVFDSDAMQKPEVHQALKRLNAFLESRQAQVTVLYLPPGERGEKVGVDDYLAAGHTVEDLLALSEDTLRLLSMPDLTSPFVVRNGAMWWRKRDDKGHEEDICLANFTATITAEVVRDDGVGSTRHFEVTAHVAGEETIALIP